MLRLKAHKETLPSGLQFTDEKSGKVFDPYEIGVEGVVAKVIQHRVANPKLYSRTSEDWFHPAKVRQEVYESAFKKRPDLFERYDGTTQVRRQIASFAAIQTESVCECGEKESTPEYCPTCSGKRQIGVKCVKCGKVRRR